jgi:flap endonuclease-1
MSSEDVQKALQLKRKPFVDFALLLGTDFSPRLRGIGPCRALEYIQAHKTIERVVKAEEDCQLQGTAKKYLKQIRMARRVFRKLPPLPDYSEVQPLASDEETVMDVLRKYGFQRWLAKNRSGTECLGGLEGNYFGDDPSNSIPGFYATQRW